MLGANDGLISTPNLIAGVAGLVARAVSMAAGEYVSVSSQADTEEADMARERLVLATQPEAELAELAAIYEQRGVAQNLAREVVEQMMAKDAFDAHARDETGLSSHVMARPVQAALASAATFATGAALLLAVALLVPEGAIVSSVSVACLIGLAVLGAIGAGAGGAGIWKPTVRVVF